MKNGRIEKLNLLAGTNFLSLYEAEYKNKAGNNKSWTIASRKNYDNLKAQYFEGKEERMDAVIIAAFHEEQKKIVVIKQFRVPINDYVYELPAGLIDSDEKIDVAAKRELKEETGLELINIDHEKTRNNVYASAGMTDESAAIVFCTCKGEISKDYMEEDEDIETFLMSKEEVKELLKTDAKIDMRAFIMLQGFAEIGEKMF